MNPVNWILKKRRFLLSLLLPGLFRLNSLSLFLLSSCFPSCPLELLSLAQEQPWSRFSCAKGSTTASFRRILSLMLECIHTLLCVSTSSSSVCVSFTSGDSFPVSKERNCNTFPLSFLVILLEVARSTLLRTSSYSFCLMFKQSEYWWKTFALHSFSRDIRRHQ